MRAHLKRVAVRKRRATKRATKKQGSATARRTQTVNAPKRLA
jgi:hypothetical protein